MNQGGLCVEIESVLLMHNGTYMCFYAMLTTKLYKSFTEECVAE